ncbi:MAG: hypothetical protein P8075_01165 [Deltaproteobacteria bacterium]|jgi:hypothetical protein
MKEEWSHCWLGEKDYPWADCFGTVSTSATPEQVNELPEILKIEAGEMEKANCDT